MKMAVHCNIGGITRFSHATPFFETLKG